MTTKIQIPVKHDFDSIFDRVVGSLSLGRYQAFLACCIQYSCLMLAGNFYMMSFGTLKPTLRCESLESQSSDYTNNSTHDNNDYCQLIKSDNCSKSVVVESEFYSITQQFGLDCDRDYIPSLMTSVQMIGQAIGNPTAGHLADHFGRKRVFYAGFFAFITAGLLCALAPNWQILTALMFVLGFSFSLYMSSMFVLAMESSGKRYRLFMNCSFQWCISFQVVALAAYLTRDWRAYMLTINGMCLPLIVLMFFVQESPRWAVQKRHFDQAAGVFNKMAVWNRRTERVTAAEVAAIDVETRRSGYSVLLMYSTKKLALYSILCMLTSYFSASASGVILFNVGSLAGSPFLNVALYGLLRVWVPPLLIYTERKKCSLFGRRPMFLLSLAFVILCFIGLTTIYSLNSNNNKLDSSSALGIFATILALAGSCVDASFLCVAYTQYMTELFPTVIRAIAFGMFNLVDNLGSVTAPQLIYLQKYWPALPYVITAAVGSIAWTLAFFILPETSDRALADTFEDAEKIKRPSPSSRTDEKNVVVAESAFE